MSFPCPRCRGSSTGSYLGRATAAYQCGAVRHKLPHGRYHWKATKFPLTNLIPAFLPRRQAKTGISLTSLGRHSRCEYRTAMASSLTRSCRPNERTWMALFPQQKGAGDSMPTLAENACWLASPGIVDRENKAAGRGSSPLVDEAGHPRYIKLANPCPRLSFPLNCCWAHSFTGA